MEREFQLAQQLLGLMKNIQNEDRWICQYYTDIDAFTPSYLKSTTPDPMMIKTALQPDIEELQSQMHRIEDSFN